MDMGAADCDDGRSDSNIQTLKEVCSVQETLPASV